jgi:hypothetical protein
MVEVRSEHLLPLVMLAGLPVDTSTDVVEPLTVITSRTVVPTTDSTLPPLIGPELILTVVAASAGIAAAVLRARAAPDRSTAPNVRRSASLIMRTSVCVLVK